jgi:hypothetical protein
LIRAVQQHGTNWTTIAGKHAPSRTTLALKNRYMLLRTKMAKVASPAVEGGRLPATISAVTDALTEEEEGDSDSDFDSESENDDENVAMEWPKQQDHPATTASPDESKAPSLRAPGSSPRSSIAPPSSSHLMPATPLTAPDNQDFPPQYPTHWPYQQHFVLPRHFSFPQANLFSQGSTTNSSDVAMEDMDIFGKGRSPAVLHPTG